MSVCIVKAMSDLYSSVSFGGGGGSSSSRGTTNGRGTRTAGVPDAAVCVGVVGLTNDWRNHRNGGLGAMALCATLV